MSMMSNVVLKSAPLCVTEKHRPKVAGALALLLFFGRSRDFSGQT
jgi:hypothetical protein